MENGWAVGYIDNLKFNLFKLAGLNQTKKTKENLTIDIERHYFYNNYPIFTRSSPDLLQHGKSSIFFL